MSYISENLESEPLELSATPEAAAVEDRSAAAPVASIHQTCPEQDRRVLRTRAALRAALVELIEEKGYDALTINDLCQRANVNRGTFYNHFHDKEGMMLSFENEVLEDLESFHRELLTFELKDLVRLRLAKKPLPFLVELFDYLRERADFLHAALGPKGDVGFMPRLRDTVCTNFVMGVLSPHYREDPTSFVNYYVAFYASAYMGIIMRWLETGMQESSEEMARIAMRMLFIKPGEKIEL